MISPQHCQLMARYNEWMNSRLYALCATLPEEDLRQDRGAFFKSIYLTLNHIAYGDLAFMSRFSGVPAVVPELDLDLFGSFAALHKERVLLDARIIEWTQQLGDEWLAHELSYESKVDGRVRTMPRWASVSHMFNHETHHRGQVTTLLRQMGLDMGNTDIPFMPEFASAA